MSIAMTTGRRVYFLLTSGFYLRGAAEDEAEDEPITGLRTVRQQLALIRKRRQTNPMFSAQSPEPFTLTLSPQQRQRLQQQLQQHIQLLTQINLLASPVPKLHSEAETTRQFLFELDMLAQSGEIFRSANDPGFRSSFRTTNLQGALELLEELRQTPIDYRPQNHKPDGRGHMRCFPVMPAELAWLFATRPVFLYPELLPCANLDPAMYCPRRTAAFTAAEDCLLVLGLRNMEGACDPPKLVSQFLLRKTVVQVRRRILQCCRPGSPDNIVKAFRYQQVVWPMMAACSNVDPAELRPPVAREEKSMPLWLVRSLPVIYPIIKLFNSPPGSSPEAPASSRRGKTRHLAQLRSSYSFPSGTRYPPRLPQNLDFRRIGFFLLQPQPAASPQDASEGPADRASHVLLKRLLLSRKEQNSDIIITSTISLPTTEQIKYHSRTLAGLRRRSSRRRKTRPCAPAAGKPSLKEVASSQSSASCVDAGDEDEATAEEELEEESDVLLVLSESSPSVSHDDDDDLPGLSESEPQRKAAEDEDEEEAQQQEKFSSEETEEEEDDGQRESEDVVFAQDYLHRVSSLLRKHPDLQDEVQEIFQQLHSCSQSAGQNPSSGTGEPIDPLVEGDEDDDREQQAVCAKNITVSSSGEKVVVWTRDADRAILTACQQRGATTKTFRQVSALLGNKTVKQVRLRFQDLMKLFLSASQRSSRAESAPD
ncbi:hypothetical protein CCH79_00014074 [Gambusia affinis]|uniref:CASP8-associated protein 2 n=1 Tax=Gambusia affinis TaxID=33528 RepID=A0A315WBY6_GAMAF|nr:hypothetical protein CCH79_00014074 [Gambusia affinis]